MQTLMDITSIANPFVESVVRTLTRHILGQTEAHAGNTG